MAKIMKVSNATLLLTILLFSVASPMANQQPEAVLSEDGEVAFSSATIPDFGFLRLDSYPVSYENRSEDTYLCGLNETGYVGCYGNGYYIGQALAFRNYNPQLLAYQGDYMHSCGIDISRQVICSGYNNYGQLGDGTFTNEQAEFVSPSIPTPYQALHLAYGNDNYCAALVNNSIYCWGKNSYNMVSPTTSSSTPIPTPTFLQLELNGTVKQLTGGYENFCALSSFNEIKCWGGPNIPNLLQSNLSDEVQQITSGRNGTNTSGTRFNWTTTKGCWAPNETIEIHLSMENLSHQQVVFEWDLASNSNGNVLDSGAPTVNVSSSGFVNYTLEISPLGSVQHRYHELMVNPATTSLDNIFQNPFYRGIDIDSSCFGGSSEGEGNSGPLHALDGETIEQIVVDRFAACALTDLSDVYCWGRNRNGIFGTNAVDDSLSFPVSPAILPSEHDVERLIMSSEHACVLLSNSGVYCWGKSISSPLNQPKPLRVGNTSFQPGYSDIILRAAGQLVGITEGGENYMYIEEETISPFYKSTDLIGYANTHLSVGIWSTLFNNNPASSFNISVDLPQGLVLNFSNQVGLPYISGVPTQNSSSVYTITIQSGNTSFSSEFEYSFIRDSDADGIFDNLDEDDDNDGVLDGDDDCPFAYGLSQFIQTGCPDSDLDGYPDLHDTFPYDRTQQQDSDSDGFGDNVSGNNGDDCPLSFGRSIFGGFFGCWDSDNDGWADLLDVFVNDSSQWLDTDGDGFGDNIIGFRGDACPEIAGTSTIDAFGCPDLDGDGVSDSTDHFPDDHSIWLDSDGDGVDDGLDAFPFEPGQSQDTDGDGYGDNRFGGASADFFPMDPTQWSDIDGDGYGDNQNGTNPDAFMADPTQWFDADGDGYGDNPAGRQADAFPGDPTQWEDMDGDGLGDNQSGNNPDPFLFDFDNDGYNDSIDPLPKLASPGDMDNDGTLDSDDLFPSDAREWADSDGDGEGDNADTDDDNDGWPDSDEIRAGTDPYSSSSQPVDTFEIVVPGTAIGLGAWDLIGIFGGVPLFAWIGFGFVTRNSRAGKFETRLKEAKSRNELEEIATQWEYALMLRLIGPHQGIRLERLRSELDDWFENQSQPLASVGTHDSMHQTHLVENEMDQHDTTKVVPSIDVDSISIPAPSQIADSVDMDGYEWYTSEDGSNFHRTAGSSEEWVKFEN